MASAGEDRRVKIWDLASSNLFKEFRGHNETVHSLVWSSDSNLLVSGGMDGIIKLWDIHKPDSEKFEHSIPTKNTNLLNLTYSPHNTLIATGCVVNSKGWFLRRNPLKNYVKQNLTTRRRKGLMTFIVTAPHLRKDSKQF